MEKETRGRTASLVASVMVYVLQALLLAGFVWDVVRFAQWGRYMDMPSLMVRALNAVNYLGLIALLFPVAGLVRSMRQRTPLIAKNVRRLKIVAIIVAVIALLQIAFDIIFGGSGGMGVIGGADGITKVMDYNAFQVAPPVMLVFALVAWCAALVFGQGVLLQQQSDETL